ncbi:glucosamine-6-phosphate deaminase [Kocuria palustris]|uniref:glucosamine-6-phosphate deaminase n=1 Tax=Kocuria palustris TaxID=71999 RepID=UPI00119EF9AC|nr:glucosamine-6-phosphate deaminase [Kocuria palustris]
MVRVVVATEEQAGRLAAEAVAAVVDRLPRPVLGLATGSSPRPVYRAIAQRVRDGALSLVHARAFLLDEYLGLPADHPQSYRAEIERELVERTDLPSTAVQSLDGTAGDVEAECAAYERAIHDAGGVDLQLLGIGTDGHIGFNEPGSPLDSRTRRMRLAQRTREDNARFFDDDIDRVPTHCLTQGIATILQARHLVLLAFGEAKAEAVRQLVEGPVTERWPATALQRHPHVTVLIDEAAASRLSGAASAQDDGWTDGAAL